MQVSEERGCWAGQAAGFSVPAGEAGDAAVSRAVI